MGGPRAHPELTVIVPVRNRDLSRLRNAVGSLRPALGQVAAEIIISDCGSDDAAGLTRLAEEVGGKHVRIEHTHWSKPLAMNSAMQEAQGAWILCADADVWWAPGSIESGYWKACSGGSLVAFQVQDLDEESTVRLAASGSADAGEARALADTAVIHSRWGTGLLLFPRRDAMRIGGYDERLSVYGAEDTDFCARMQSVGWPLVWSDLTDEPALHQWHPRFTSGALPWARRVMARNTRLASEDRSTYRNLGGRLTGRLVAAYLVGRTCSVDTVGSILLQSAECCSVLAEAAAPSGARSVAAGVAFSARPEHLRGLDAELVLLVPPGVVLDPGAVEGLTRLMTGGVHYVEGLLLGQAPGAATLVGEGVPGPLLVLKDALVTAMSPQCEELPTAAWLADLGLRGVRAATPCGSVVRETQGPVLLVDDPQDVATMLSGKHNAAVLAGEGSSWLDLLDAADSWVTVEMAGRTCAAALVQRRSAQDLANLAHRANLRASLTGPPPRGMETGVLEKAAWDLAYEQAGHESPRDGVTVVVRSSTGSGIQTWRLGCESLEG